MIEVVCAPDMLLFFLHEKWPLLSDKHIGLAAEWFTPIHTLAVVVTDPLCMHRRSFQSKSW